MGDGLWGDFGAVVGMRNLPRVWTMVFLFDNLTSLLHNQGLDKMSMIRLEMGPIQRLRDWEKAWFEAH